MEHCLTRVLVVLDDVKWSKSPARRAKKWNIMRSALQVEEEGKALVGPSEVGVKICVTSPPPTWTTPEEGLRNEILYDARPNLVRITTDVVGVGELGNLLGSSTIATALSRHKEASDVERPGPGNLVTAARTSYVVPPW